MFTLVLHFTYGIPSFFSAVFAATKNFPSLIGIASSTSMVMFGLSPLFLSLFATNTFTDPQSGLDLTHYLIFLALVGGTANLFGAFVLTVPDHHAVLERTDEESEVTINENTSLLPAPKKCDEESHVIAVQEPDEVSLKDLIKDPYFLVLFAFVSLTIGCVSVYLTYWESHTDRSRIDRDGAVEYRNDNAFLTPCLFCGFGEPTRSHHRHASAPALDREHGISTPVRNNCGRRIPGRSLSPQWGVLLYQETTI